MNYSDKACTDAALNVNPANGKVFLYDNATVNFLKNTYVSLGKIDESETIRGISIFISSSITTASTGTWIIGSNLLHTPNYKVRYIIIDFTNKKLNVLINTTLHTWDININSGLFSIAFKLAITNTGTVNGYALGGYSFSNYTTSEVEDIENDCVFINAYKDKDGNIITSDVSTFTNAYIRDQLTLYSDPYYNGTPIHGYYMAEVEGNVIYDTIGNTNGRLIAPSITNVRARYNYNYAANTYKGFREDTESEEPISSAKIPLGKDLCIYKSAFETNTTVDAWTGSSNSVIDGKLVVSVPRASNNCRVQLVDTRLKSSQIGRTLKVKYKISNLNAIKLPRIYITVGSPYAESYGLGYTKTTETLVSLAQGESIEKEFILRKGAASGTNFSNLIQVYCLYESALEVGTQAFSIDYLEIYQTDTLVDYPMVEFGKNASESRIIFGDQAAIPELTFLDDQLTRLFTNLGPNPKDWVWKNPDPSMGAETGSGWDITSAPTSNITNGSWRCMNKRVLYCKNHDTTDLPEGVSSAIDLRTASDLSSSGTHNMFNCTQTMRPWSYVKRPRFHAKVSCWVKVNPAITSGSVLFQVGFNYIYFCDFSFTTNNNYMNHEWVRVEYDNPNVINPVVNRSTSVNYYFGITANSSTVGASIPWLLAIADLQVEFTPSNSFLSPFYADYDLETNSIKNIKLYQKNLEKYYVKSFPMIGNNLTYTYCVGGIDATRIMNNLK